jgi:hypothetical protein
MLTTSHNQWVLPIRLTVIVVLFLLSPRLTATPIDLRCYLRDTYLRADYKGKSIFVEKSLCEKLREHLARDPVLRAWDYVANGSGSGAALEFIVRSSENIEGTDLILRFVRPDVPPQSWEAAWRQPGDRSRVPDPLPEKAPDVLAAAFERLLLKAFEAQIQDVLKRVPIASASWLPYEGKGFPRMVSSLSWRDHQGFRASLFRVSCKQHSDRENIEFESRGSDRPAPFAPEGTSKAFDALTLVVMYRLPDRKVVQEIISDVLTLKPSRLYLVEYRPPDLPEIY